MKVYGQIYNLNFYIIKNENYKYKLYKYTTKYCNSKTLLIDID